MSMVGVEGRPDPYLIYMHTLRKIAQVDPVWKVKAKTIAFNNKTWENHVHGYGKTCLTGIKCTNHQKNFLKVN